MPDNRKKLSKLGRLAEGRMEVSQMCSEWPRVLEMANHAFPMRRGVLSREDLNLAVQTNVDLLILWLSKATMVDLMRREIEIGDRS